jgi:hypothetical protein
VSEAHWNPATLAARIADPSARRRHPGGSPDHAELGAYAAALGDTPNRGGTALVLGMTPELRSLALQLFARVIAVDSNPHAIALYRDWIAPADQPRECLVRSDWFSLRTVIKSPVSAVLADGVFGNLPDLTAHVQLLEAIASVLLPAGCFVTRMAMIPDGFDPRAHRADRLQERFRAGEIDEAEYGFGMRLVGNYETCYDPRTSLLDNARLFAQCAARHAAGELTEVEHAAIRRYYFGGFNCILSQRDWEGALHATGWNFQTHRCCGKAWYDYYPIYACQRD